MSSLPRTAILPILLFLTFVQSPTVSAQSSWRAVGTRGDWQYTGPAIGGGNVIYSVSGRTVYWTNLSTGKSYVVAQGYEGAHLPIWMDGLLYIIQDNNLYVIDTDAGSWRRLGDTWSKTKVMTGMDGYLWSMEDTGTLYRTDKNGKDQQVGRANALREPMFLAALNGTLYAVADDTLYAFNNGTSEWRAIAPQGHERDMVTLQSSGGYLWALRQDGSLSRSTMTGNWQWERVGAAGE
jgi:hypothetical protein